MQITRAIRSRVDGAMLNVLALAAPANATDDSHKLVNTRFAFDVPALQP